MTSILIFEKQLYFAFCRGRIEKTRNDKKHALAVSCERSYWVGSKSVCNFNGTKGLQKP